MFPFHFLLCSSAKPEILSGYFDIFEFLVFLCTCMETCESDFKMKKEKVLWKFCFLRVAWVQTVKPLDLWFWNGLALKKSTKVHQILENNAALFKCLQMRKRLKAFSLTVTKQSGKASPQVCSANDIFLNWPVHIPERNIREGTRLLKRKNTPGCRWAAEPGPLNPDHCPCADHGPEGNSAAANQLRPRDVTWSGIQQHSVRTVAGGQLTTWPNRTP